MQRSPLNWSFARIADFDSSQKITIRSLVASFGTGN
jgi:hypothetical protein